MMTPELLAALKAIYQQFLDGYHGGPMTLLRNLIATIEDEPEQEVLAEEGAEVYIRGSRAYAEVGGGMIRLDTSEGLRDGAPLTVTVTRRAVAAPEREEGE
jgi:hypothetical protein